MEQRRMEAVSKSSCWELWRQDDNGNRLLVASFEEREVALTALDRFESQHHKQTYWIEEKKVAGPEAGQPTQSMDLISR
jgi:hypothetical protein